MKRRTVVESDLFRAHAKQLEPNTKRLDEMIEAAVWEISRAAESFPEVEGTALRSIVTRAPYCPTIIVFFTIDNDDECTLCTVRVADRSKEE